LLLVLTFFLSWCDRSHRTSVEAALRHYLPWFPTRMGLLSDDVRRKSPWHNIWRCLDRIQKSPFVVSTHCGLSQVKYGMQPESLHRRSVHSQRTFSGKKVKLTALDRLVVENAFLLCVAVCSGPNLLRALAPQIEVRLGIKGRNLLCDRAVDSRARGSGRSPSVISVARRCPPQE
jgi:hypothetical protein